MKTKVTHVQVSFDKEELFKVYNMMHDSVSHWRNHLNNAEQNSDYFLNVEGCRAVLKNCEKTYSDISELYHKHFG